jgi:nucleotide-binding universal stress UspA family protein
MKVLFPVDGSEYTKRMLAYVAVHEELVAAANEHIFVHVVPELPSVATRQMLKSAIDDFYGVEAEAVFEPIQAFAKQQGWTSRFERLHGHAATQIAEFAEREGVSLIVMGSHGHGALASAALGSVATGVLARCRLPLLLLR